MTRRGVWQALLLLAALTAVSCGPEPEGAPPEAAGTASHSAGLRFRPIHSALVLSTRLEGEPSSREAQAAAGAGLNVHVVTPAEWRAMTAEQFNDYRILIIGDEACTEDRSSALQAAIDTRQRWGPFVTGNILVIASDPSTNRTPLLVERGVEFALARDDATGLYVSLGCAWQGAAPGTPLELLEPFGNFLVAGVGCHAAAHTFVMTPKELTSELYGDDDRLRGEQCAARTVFTQYPEESFATVALAVDTNGSMPGAQPYPDPFWNNSSGGIFVGSPYILARGARPRIPGSAPEARCRNLVLDADRTCGASGSIDDGSSDPDGDLVGCTQSPAGPYPLGTTTVTLTCTDSQQESSSCIATVQVRDVTAPELLLIGSASQQAECGRSYTDPGATAHDFCDGDLSSAITRSGNVDPRTPGTYGLTYDVADSSGNRAPSASRTVHVRDTLAPIVRPIGSLNMAVECGDGAYVDPGATATDVCAGALPATPISAADPRTPGTYRVNYRATDPSGNTGVSAETRVVTVSDTLPPVVTLHPPLDQRLECGTPYTDPGLTVIDQCFGDLTSTVIAGTVNSGVPGSYVLTYVAADPVGNVSDPQHRTINVVDTLSPEITVFPPLEDSHECNSPYVDPGATANDRCFGEVPVVATRTGSPNQPGSFTITYSAMDGAGNAVTSPVVRRVTVTDNAPPVLTLLGPNPDVVECSPTPYADPGAIATDQCFGDLTSAIRRAGSVNPRVPGTYSLTYDVTDPAGNSAVPVSRTVQVRDTQPPLVTINGPVNLEYECDRGESFLDPGVSAFDMCAGALPVDRSGEVDLGQPGVYSLTYTVRDPSGNGGTFARLVTVSDSLAPWLIVPFNPLVECGTPFSDPVIATDQCFGDLTSRVVRTGNVDASTPGSYPVTYSVTDPAGYSAQASTTFRVYDTFAPVVTLNGPPSVTIVQGTPWVDPGATARDACDGEISTIVITGHVDTDIPGTYLLTYIAVDRTGNFGSTVRTVTVVAAAAGLASRTSPPAR